MNTPKSSIASGSKFPQMLVDQRPRFEQARLFRRKLRPGRPSKKHTKQYWIK